MPLILEFPSQYGYVLAAATTTFFINSFHGILTSKARKSSGIKYPVAYASQELCDKDPAAFTFNCAQRAHGNFTESLTPLLGALAIAGLRFPLPAAIAGLGWSISRVAYAIGYVNSGPKGRGTGAIGSFIFDAGLKFMAAYTSVMFALGN